MKETARIRQTAKASHDTREDLNQASKLGLGIILSLAGLVGAWSLACLVGALSTQGIGGVVRGFMTAVTGM